MKKLAFYIITLFISLQTLQAREIYVSTRGNDANEGTKTSPLKTVTQALKQAREWRRLNEKGIENGITILLDEGLYKEAKTLLIRPEDSGNASSPTIIRSVKDKKAVISGGISVNGWQQGCNDPRIAPALRSLVWWTDAPLIGNRQLEFRQMWVNGTKAQRVSQFAEGVLERMIDFNPHDETITIPTPDIAGLQNAKQLEMLVHQRWAIAILRVASMEQQGRQTVVRFHQPESQLEFAHPWPQPVIGGERGNSSFCLMNALELLNLPGEWFQDYPNGRIYYLPRLGEDMTQAEVIVPAQETLLEIAGTPERPVQHIYFDNIRFEHASWMRPSHEGHVPLQGGFPLIDAYKLYIPGLPEKAELENQAWIKRPESAITATYANHIIFDGCTFQRMGSTGLDLAEGVSNSKVQNCIFTDIGGTGLMIGTFPDGGFETHIPYKPALAQKLCSNIDIHNNLITKVTNEDWGAVGIGAGYVKGINITNNEVSHVNYSGICVGWGWTPLESGMSDNRIEANYVHHFAQQLYDAGGLYTLSNQPRSVMRNNRLEALVDAPYATNERAFYIYFDEATDGYTVENNWCPEERFDSNRPGPNNQWINNGPSVAEIIKTQAGRINNDNFLSEDTLH